MYEIPQRIIIFMPGFFLKFFQADPLVMLYEHVEADKK